MNVLMISKACVFGAYQRKLEELAARGVTLTALVPPYWKDERGVILLEKKFTHGYRLIVAPMRFNGHFHIHYYPSLAQVLREIHPDIVHIDEEPWDFVTFHAVRGARAIGARPLFFTWQNLLRFYPPPFSGFTRYSFRHCAHAIAGNADAQHVLCAKGYRGEISIIPQFGADPSIFQPRPEPGRKADADAPFVIGYIGRLIPEKGVDTLLRAVSGLDGRWEARLLGAGPARDGLQRLAAQLRLDGRVVFQAQVPSTQMAAYYQQLDLLVLPSRRALNWTEQFGRVLVEAMACGVPVIGSDCGEIPNVIGDAGLIFHANDADALRAHIRRVMSDADLRAQMSHRGRARVMEKFTMAGVAQRTVEVYEQMMRH
ncbi:MAG: glycosyltransferase family 4 protein [Chloroflexi bacterium]|nr:glycosyltransferase family 4 protein [Chloroflexota bacterium]